MQCSHLKENFQGQGREVNIIGFQWDTSYVCLKMSCTRLGAVVTVELKGKFGIAFGLE